jgi:hypothetical protein
MGKIKKKALLTTTTNEPGITNQGFVVLTALQLTSLSKVM